MPCDPNANSLNPDAVPNYPIPGFPGLPSSPVQIPDFAFPPGFPQDLLDLIEQFGALFPSGEFKPNLDDAIHTIMTALASLFNQLAPFLSLYKFFMALLNMVLCIMEVMCAMYNVRKTLRALRRLFKRCLPDFLALFPWAALLAMIIALLLLILALLMYIIDKIIALIRDLLRNLELLGKAVTLNDADAQEAIAIKIASLLCLIENLFAIFTAIAAILAIINTLAAMGGYSACNGNSILGLSCCDDETCPPFIDDHPDGYIDGASATMVYYREIGRDAISLLNFSRRESWQFVNTPSDYPFKDVITDYGLGDFWPEGKSYDGTSSLSRVPYTVNMTLDNFDPSVYHPADTGGARTFIIRDAVVAVRPYIGVLDQSNNVATWNIDGTFSLKGGRVYDQVFGNTYYVDGKAATLETFIHLDAMYSGIVPGSDDGHYYTNVDFEWHFDHEALAENGLITLGCIPDLKIEREVLNARFSETRSVFDQVAKLPDSGGGGIIPDYTTTQACAANALAELRRDVNPDSVLAYQTQVLACLSDAITNTKLSYTNVLTAGVNAYKSEISLTPEVEFVSRPITVTAVLKDPAGATLTTNIPADLQSDIANLITGTVTLGSVSDFTYDGYEAFVAEITSITAGDGELTVAFDGNTLQRVLNLNTDNASSIEPNSLTYEFIGTGGDDTEAKVRRDGADVARSGE